MILFVIACIYMFADKMPTIKPKQKEYNT